MKYTDFAKKTNASRDKIWKNASRDKIWKTAKTRVDHDFLFITQKAAILECLEEKLLPQLKIINPTLDEDFQKKLDTATQQAINQFDREYWQVTDPEFEPSKTEFQFLLELTTHTRALLSVTISTRFFVQVYKAINNDFLGFVFPNKFVMNYLACLMGGIPQVFTVEEKKSALTYFKDMFKTNPHAYAMRTFPGKEGQEKTLYVAAHMNEETGNLYPVFKNENILKIFYQFFNWNLKKEAIKPTYLVLHHPELFPGLLSQWLGTQKGDNIRVHLKDPTLGCDKNENMMTHFSLFRILPSSLVTLVLEYEGKHGCANCSP
jgi:hypothetical protein